MGGAQSKESGCNISQTALNANRLRFRNHEFLALA
jgi:hypothetical protein